MKPFLFIPIFEQSRRRRLRFYAVHQVNQPSYGLLGFFAMKYITLILLSYIYYSTHALEGCTISIRIIIEYISKKQAACFKPEQRTYISQNFRFRLSKCALTIGSLRNLKPVIRQIQFFSLIARQSTYVRTIIFTSGSVGTTRGQGIIRVVVTIF